MAQIKLDDYQIDAIHRMRNGCVLNGGVGSGKSRTALGYYYLENGGSESSLLGGPYKRMDKSPRDLYIITTAMKRDSLEWEGELVTFLMTKNRSESIYDHNIVVDSWNNIKKYKDVYGAFFIFDEQRVCGSGAWVKAFLNIARKNKWILLSATAGDCWSDYIPVFVANGYYKHKTEFIQEHVVYSRFSKYPKIDRYLNTGRLIRQRNELLINMDFKRNTIPHDEDIYVRYDIDGYKDICKNRWNPYTNEPIKTASEFCYLLRKVVNSDISRQIALLEIIEKHPKAIIFYNYDYELDILKSLYYGEGTVLAEHNGHKHDLVPDTDRWVYFVQYNSGAEGWNCITTDTIIFFSQTYSYKVLTQSKGRIDRRNTPFKDLYYYHLRSRSGIDLAITRALRNKKQFNESSYFAMKGV